MHLTIWHAEHWWPKKADIARASPVGSPTVLPILLVISNFLSLFCARFGVGSFLCVHESSETSVSSSPSDGESFSKCHSLSRLVLQIIGFMMRIIERDHFVVGRHLSWCASNEITDAIARCVSSRFFNGSTRWGDATGFVGRSHPATSLLYMPQPNEVLQRCKGQCHKNVKCCGDASISRCRK